MDVPQTRRIFIRDIGRGVVALTVGGSFLAACSTGDQGEPPASEPSTTPTRPPSSTSTTGAAAPPSSTSTSRAVTVELTVGRVNLDFVSAYVLVRGAGAAIVDTGVEGSTDAVERGLAEVGLAWSDVGQVILTHRHGDHVGSLPEVATRAADAVLYAGVADIEAITAPRPIEGVGDGDTVFGLEVVDTPGHTPGHIAVFDPATAILVAGDSLNGEGSGVANVVDGVGGPNPRFTPDMATAIESVRKLAGLTPDTIYFGHGEPKIGDAAAALDELVARL